uniref:Uncharacterized protein n=1 Tax=Kalanchoe fedtschenkoi TaxID=63787 RepID=A0A7N0TKU4_KALFE
MMFASDFTAEFHPQIQIIESEVSFLRRRLVEDSSNRNLAAAPAPDAPPSNIGAGSTPLMHNSGAFPAVPGEGMKQPGAPVPSPLPGAQPFLFVVATIMICMCRSKAVATIGLWKTGLSGQLQKAFITGVLKLNRSELETACEDFSNIFDNLEGCTVYKGTLSSWAEIAVISASVASAKEWTKRSETLFRKKVS